MVHAFYLESYRFTALRNNYKMSVNKPSEPYSYSGDGVKSYDQMLHQALAKIRTSFSSRQMNKLVSNQKSIIKLVLKQKPTLRRHLSRKEYTDLPLLWIAVLSSYYKSVELLVHLGADVVQPFGKREPQIMDEKWNVLHVLIQMYPSAKNEQLIRLIADHGADLHALDSYGRNVLYLAVERGRVQLTEMFLEKGVDVNVGDERGRTPLFAALFRNGKVDQLLPMLRKHGADILAKNLSGMNALHHVAFSRVKNFADLVRELIEKGVSLCEPRGYTLYQPIHYAVNNGKNALMELFLDLGANVNARAHLDVSPLYLAAQWSRTAMMKTLLDRGADINMRTTLGNTALHRACECVADQPAWENAIRLLLSAGADLLAEDDEGQTPFALIERKHVKCPSTRLLLRVLALKKVHLPSIELKDERIIRSKLELWNYYQDCVEEIDKMKVTRFIDSCTFFELLAKNLDQIAALMRNPDFEANFELYDLSVFSKYAEDILRAFELAQNRYRSILKLEDVINEAFYYTLPHVVLRRVIHYMFLNDRYEGAVK